MLDCSWCVSDEINGKSSNLHITEVPAEASGRMASELYGHPAKVIRVICLGSNFSDSRTSLMARNISEEGSGGAGVTCGREFSYGCWLFGEGGAICGSKNDCCSLGRRRVASYYLVSYPADLYCVSRLYPDGVGLQLLLFNLGMDGGGTVVTERSSQQEENRQPFSISLRGLYSNFSMQVQGVGIVSLLSFGYP